MKWTIRRKLLLSFICMALLTITASSYAVYRLYDLTRKADYIVNNNVSFMEQVRTLVATVVAMEEAAKKYPILKDPDIAALYYTRSREFDQLLERITVPAKNGANEKESVKSRKRHLDQIFAEEESLILEGNQAEAMQLAARGSGTHHRYTHLYPPELGETDGSPH